MGTLGYIRIGADEYGIVEKKFGPTLKKGRIALNGEAGFQAETLGPGRHYGFVGGLYSIKRLKPIVIPQGQIGLVVARDGALMPASQQLGRIVDCDNFQDARAFLENGGQQGRQLGILTAGEYRIHTELFEVITATTMDEDILGDYGKLTPDDLRVYRIDNNHIGLVTTLDGEPTPFGEIAGRIVSGHSNFQNGQAFIAHGGQKGLQEEFIPSGAYNLNPWFVEVEQVSLTNIPTGTVGVVVSDVGLPAPSSDTPVDAGYKGVRKIPLPNGWHPINTKVQNVHIVPTHDITLNWTDEIKPKENYDANLDALHLNSSDGFSFKIEVTQVIRIRDFNAPRMIARVGPNELNTVTSNTHDESVKFASIHNLVHRVLEPMISTYFQDSAQGYKAIDFLNARRDRHREAKVHIRGVLKDFGVEAVDTYIKKIHLPPELSRELQRKEIAILQEEAIGVERRAEEARIETEELVVQARERNRLVVAKYQRAISQLDAEGQFQFARHMLEALGAQGFVELERVRQLPHINLPQTMIGNMGLGEALIAQAFGMNLGIQQNQLPIGSNDDLRQLLSGLTEFIKENPTEIEMALRSIPTKSLQQTPVPPQVAATAEEQVIKLESDDLTEEVDETVIEVESIDEAEPELEEKEETQPVPAPERKKEQAEKPDKGNDIAIDSVDIDIDIGDLLEEIELIDDLNPD